LLLAAGLLTQAAAPIGHRPIVLAIDSDVSQVVIDVGKAGVFSFAGHIHEVVARARGRVTFEPDDWQRSAIALEFDAATLPALPEGWTRTLVLHADGYCKDMDLYTAAPETVGPLPFHAMGNYPPSSPPPDPAATEAYQRRWNTRVVPK